jgi:formate hydrogenlyase subunit 6/NADH:ubiquinone oxidoreductase subunit I
MACTLCQDCVEACPQNPPAIKIGKEENTFIFNLESTGALIPEKILSEATKILDEELKELEHQVKVKKSEET